MAYRELIKNFERIRDYMRQFYVYGFKSRAEYDAKSARSYDDEKRRIESWLGEYMFFRRDENGKRVFLSVDSRAVPANPLYQAFKAKSFTDGDITFHFFILDFLADGFRTVTEILDAFAAFSEAEESGVRKKLKEYEKLGLLVSEKRGREVCYCRAEDELALSDWWEAVSFFAEEDPLGVVGSFLLDKGEKETAFRFKHHYILHSLDSRILCALTDAMTRRRGVELTVATRGGEQYTDRVMPLKIYVSTQGGRRYLLGYRYAAGRPSFYRLDRILSVKEGDEDLQDYGALVGEVRQHLWGVSFSAAVQTLEMDVRVEEGEQFIADRLYREKRCGTVYPINENTYRFTAAVYDPAEMLPWLRTFIGRIVRLECSDPAVTERFYGDLAALAQMYGEGSDALS